MITAPQNLAITHTAACRGDGTADLVEPLRWRWSRSLTGWYLPRSRDAEPGVGAAEEPAADVTAGADQQHHDRVTDDVRGSGRCG